jgi:hypothetical protein
MRRIHAPDEFLDLLGFVAGGLDDSGALDECRHGDLILQS